MSKSPLVLRDSTEEQDVLRVVALWAAACAEAAILIFESRHPHDGRPRAAITACLEFGQGRKRDHNLRKVALAALQAGKGIDAASVYAARAATLAASVAYTHTDLQTGVQGIRQARHVLGSAVYAALALEHAGGGHTEIGDQLIARAIASAPSAVRHVLQHMPRQPDAPGRQSALFFMLDSALCE